MVSTHGYTTAAKVQERLKNYNTSATTSQIETFISHAEGFIISVTKVQWKTTIPLLVESVATDLAALYLLANDPSGFSSTPEAAFIADILWAQSRRALITLSDDQTKKFLEGLQ